MKFFSARGRSLAFSRGLPKLSTICIVHQYTVLFSISYLQMTINTVFPQATQDNHVNITAYGYTRH
jgi:hypothetical protein